MNKLSPGLAILKTLNDYFEKTDYDTVLVLILLVCPAIITTVYLFFGRSEQKVQIDTTKAVRKNMDFFEIVRLQKGLEEFDRDFLYETAEKYHCFPPYNILLEEGEYLKVEREMIKDLSNMKIEPTKNKKFQYFMRLKIRLFNS